MDTSLLCSEASPTAKRLMEVAAPDVIDLMDTECFNKVVKKQFGIDVTTLYALDTPNTENVIKIAAFENHTHEWEPPERARWIGREALNNLTLVRPLIRSVLETWFAEFTESDTVESLMPWSKIGWFDETAIWITEQLHRLRITVHSPVEQVKSFYTGGTLRVNTDVGYIYFKAVPHAFIREMEITQMLAEWFPARIPVMLAADSERRWMLLGIWVA